MSDVRMDYEAVRELARAYENSADLLEEMMTTSSNIASTLRDGAMRGRAGDALAEAFESRLNGSLQRMEEKFLEMYTDLQDAVRATEEGIEASKKGYAQ